MGQVLVLIKCLREPNARFCDLMEGESSVIMADLKSSHVFYQAIKYIDQVLLHSNK